MNEKREILITTAESIYKAKSDLNDYLQFKKDNSMPWAMFAQLRVLANEKK